LIQYGSLTGFGNLPLHPGTPSPGLLLTLNNNTGTSTVELGVSAFTGNLIWTGAENQLWDTLAHATPKNWLQQGGGQSDFANGFAVVFDDSATGYSPQVSGNVQPLSMTFSNATASYTLDGTGVIAGAATLLKNAAGGLTINDGNSTFSGGSTISAGTLTLGASTTVAAGAITSGPLGTGPIALSGATVRDNGTAISIANALSIGGNLSFASSTTSGGSLTFTNQVAGNQTTLTASPVLTVDNATTIQQNIVGAGQGITIQGTGSLRLSGANTYDGGTTLTSGTLILGASTAIGGGLITSGPVGTGTLTLNGGTVSDGGTSRTLANALTIGGNVNFNGTLAFDPTGLTTPTTATISGAPTLTVDTLVTIGQAVGGSGFTKEGAGALVLLGANTYSGATLVNNGALAVIGPTGSLGATD
jgi:autotransporter-associated beta strand protein